MVHRPRRRSLRASLGNRQTSRAWRRRVIGQAPEGVSMDYIQGNAGEIRELARYEVRPEALEQCVAAIHEFVAYVRASEPGAMRYEVWQEAERPTRFVHLFIWKDEEANRVHGASAAVKKFAGILYPNCLAPVEFIEYKQVDANATFRQA